MTTSEILKIAQRLYVKAMTNPVNEPLLWARKDRETKARLCIEAAQDFSIVAERMMIANAKSQL